MKIVIGNVESQIFTGGRDNLLPFDLMKEIRNYLRVKPDGYNYSAAYKRRGWDGWKYFITPKGKFATGFLPMLLKFLDELEVPEVLIEDNRGSLPELNDDFNEFIGEIDGEIWMGRENQVKSVNALKNHIHFRGSDYYFPRGILDCATNAGKTSMAALVINNIHHKHRVIFMVSGTVIYKQAVEFFSQVLGEPVGEVRSGKVDFKRVTVCMAKTLLNRAEESLNIRKELKDTDVLIVDESDEAGAKEYSKVLSYIDAGMRIFVSGTPLAASKVNNMISVGLSGLVLHKITNKELIDAGYSQKPIVNILFNDPSNFGFFDYSKEVEENIHFDIRRAEQIAKLISRHSDKKTVVSYTILKHGEFIYDVAKKLNPDLRIALIHGGSPDRDEVLRDFKAGKIDVLFTSMILKRGANIPNIEVFIMAQGGKSTITVKQLVGRAIRHDGKSDEVLIYDFYDFGGRYVSKHSRDRIKIYKNEQFEVREYYDTKRGVAQKNNATYALIRKFWH